MGPNNTVFVVIRWRFLLPVMICAALCAGLLPKSIVAQASLLQDRSVQSHSEQEIVFAADDGVMLSGYLVLPHVQRFPTPPLVVIPASFANTRNQQLPICRWLAVHGYASITYASRGFGESGGTVDLAGAATVSDISTAIDYALAHSSARADAVGAYGQSYAAAQIVLAAARDNRIRALDAISPWVDLMGSLSPSHTRPSLTAEAVFFTATSYGRPGPELNQLSKAYKADKIDNLASMIEKRSAIYQIDALNSNRPAIQMHHTYHDSLFPSGTIVNFVERYQGPKRLYMEAGDHSRYLLSPSYGLSESTWEETKEWFDRHLLGRHNGVEESSRYIAPASNSFEVTLESQEWAALSSHSITYYATEPSWFSSFHLRPTGGLKEHQPRTTWSYPILAGLPHLFGSGLPYIDVASLQAVKVPSFQSLQFVGRLNSTVHETEPLRTDRTVAGAPRVSFNVIPNTTQFTAMVYLIETNPLGVSHMVSFAPYSVQNTGPGQLHHIDLELHPVVWHVRAGNTLNLVVSTTDIRYHSRSSIGDQLSIVSTPDHPMAVTVPYER